MNTIENAASTQEVIATTTVEGTAPETTTVEGTAPETTSAATAAAVPAEPKVAPAKGSTVKGNVLFPAAKDKQFVLVKLEGGFTGLLHESQLTGTNRMERSARLQSLTRNQALEVHVLDVTEKDGKTRISLSERALATASALAALTVGSDVVGRVQNKEKYGAFVELDGGMSGLLHVGSLPGNSPAERDAYLAAMQKDQTVKLRITKVDTSDRKVRIALVLSEVADEQEQKTAAQTQRLEQLQAGGVIKGTVLAVKDGSYIIGLGGGLSGLLAMDEVRKLSKGDHVRVKLESVEGRKLRLTRKGIA